MAHSNLRHLRLFLQVSDLRFLTRASEAAHVSQPAVTKAIRKLEQEAGGALFNRTQNGFFLTERGTVFAARVRSALGALDQALADISPRLILTATMAQLEAVMALAETENFSRAARHLGLSQPTVHRAVTRIESEAGRALFDRTSFGFVATRACQNLVLATSLTIHELRQAETDLAELDGGETGQVTIGALPLSRTVLLPQALAHFRKQRPGVAVTVIDGPYDELLSGLRRGSVDFIIGALRDPVPTPDVEQEWLFDDRLAIIAGNDHPLAGKPCPRLEDLTAYPWVVPRRDTPTRHQFDSLFADRRTAPPQSIIEAGSILLMRELMAISDHLGCISEQQANAEIATGLVGRINLDLDWPGRAIGLTYRSRWKPTRAQKLMLDLVREAVPCTGTKLQRLSSIAGS